MFQSPTSYCQLYILSALKKHPLKPLKLWIIILWLSCGWPWLGASLLLKPPLSGLSLSTETRWTHSTISLKSLATTYWVPPFPTTNAGWFNLSLTRINIQPLLSSPHFSVCHFSSHTHQTHFSQKKSITTAHQFFKGLEYLKTELLLAEGKPLPSHPHKSRSLVTLSIFSAGKRP